MRTIQEIMAALQAIIDGAADRSLTADEVTAYEALEVELQEATATDQVRRRNAAYNTTVVPAGVPAPTNRPAEDHLAGLRNYLLTGRHNVDTVQNAQSEGVPSEGGYLVPDLFRQKLVEKLKAFGGIGGIAERYSTGNGNPVDWPTLDDTGNEGEVVQEGNTFSGGADVTFGTNSLGSYSYMAGGGSATPLRVPRELIQDSAFDIEALLTRLLGTRIGRLQARHWAVGTGVNQPLGLVTGRTPVQTQATTGGITYEDLVTWIHSVDPAYRESARWLWNDNTMKAVELIVDSNGDPIFRGWGANMALGLNEATVLGYPVTIDQAMVDFDNDDSSDLFGAFGNINQGYVIRDVQAVEILVNPYSRMANRQVEFTAWARADGTQQDTAAYVVLSGKS